MYSLIIVDDEAYIREQLSGVFRWEEMGFSLKGSFAGMHDTLEYLYAHRTDVLLADIHLGGDSGLDLAAKAREIWPEIELVILSAYSDFKYAHTALRINVYDYLLKPVTYEGVSKCFEGLKETLDARRLENTVKQRQSAPEGEKSEYRIDLVKKYIERNVSEDITLEGIAGMVSMNPAYFSRFFKRHTSVYFADYLAERRIVKAIELLRDPKYKIYEICTMVGYFSKQNFYKRFRQYTGRTPIEYRNEMFNIRSDDDEE